MLPGCVLMAGIKLLDYASMRNTKLLGCTLVVGIDHERLLKKAARLDRSTSSLRNDAASIERIAGPGIGTQRILKVAVSLVEVSQQMKANKPGAEPAFARMTVGCGEGSESRLTLCGAMLMKKLIGLAP
jgi:hypothetical protein